jgi:hypothetical protein
MTSNATKIQSYFEQDFLFEEAKTVTDLENLVSDVLMNGIADALYDSYTVDTASFIDGGVAFSFTTYPNKKTYDVALVTTGVEFESLKV